MLRPVCDYVGPHSLHRCLITATYRLTPMRAAEEHPRVSHVCDRHLDVAVGTVPRTRVELIERHAPATAA